MRLLRQFASGTFALALAMLLPLAGCGGGGGGGGGGATPPADSFSQVIGPAGGTITATSGPLVGTVFTVPAGAVATDTTFTMSSGTDITTQVGDRLMGPSVAILPEGTVFAGGAATLEIPFDSSLLPAGEGPIRMVVLHRARPGNVERLQIIDFPGGRDSVVVEVPALSTFQPALPPFAVGGLWLLTVKDGPLTVSPLPTADELAVARVDIIQDLETGEATILPLEATDVNGDPIFLTGTFTGNRMSASVTYVGDDGQVTESVSLEFLSSEVGHGILTETLLGGQPTSAPMTLFRAGSLESPTFQTSSTDSWDLVIEGGAATAPSLPSSGLADTTKVVTLVELAADHDSGLTGITLFLADDLQNPFVGTATGDAYLFSRKTLTGGGTLIEILTFTRGALSAMSSGVGLIPGFSWWWGEGTIENPPAESSAGNYGSGNATMTTDS